MGDALAGQSPVLSAEEKYKAPLRPNAGIVWSVLISVWGFFSDPFPIHYRMILGPEFAGSVDNFKARYFRKRER